MLGKMHIMCVLFVQLILLTSVVAVICDLLACMLVIHFGLCTYNYMIHSGFIDVFVVIIQLPFQIVDTTHQLRDKVDKINILEAQ